MQLAKPFDFQALLDELKAQGLPMLEKDAKLVTGVVFDWAQQSCVLQGGFAAVAAPFFPMVKDQVLKIEDRIDGVAGN